MIKPQQFIALGLATVLSLLLTLGLYLGANRWASGKVEGAAFLPELAGGMGKVAAVEITQGGQKLTLERAGEAWKLRERAGYPAKPEAVRNLLRILAEAQLIEPKTSAKGRLALLELEEPAAKDAKSRGLRLLDAQAKPISSIVLGKTRWDAFGSGRGGIYARRAGETQSWLATGDPKASADIKDWVDVKLFASETAKVTRLTLEHPGEEALVVAKGPPPAAAEPAKEPAKDAKAPPAPPKQEPKFHLAKMPEGKKLKKDASIDQIVEAFASLDLEDVRKLDQTPAGDKVSVLRLEQEGGPAVTFRLRKDGEASWLSLEAAGADGDARKRADELNARAKGWEYKIPSWKAEQIGKRRADLFETS